MKIDLIDYNSNDASYRFVNSLKNTGFAVIENSPIDDSLISSVFSDWISFFNSEDKHNYLYDYEKQDGFFPFKSENSKSYIHKDLKEFFHIYKWGRYPKEISEKTSILFDEVVSIASTLLSWVGMHIDKEVSHKLSIPLMDMIKDSESNLMRIIHYPPVSSYEHEDAVRAAEHEDINLLTILCGSNQPGLQAKDNDGVWHDVITRENTISINSGDMLNLCTGGYFPSTTHRVINPSGSSNKNISRLSIPLFLHPRDDVKLNGSYTAGQYLHDRLNEIGLKKDS